MIVVPWISHRFMYAVEKKILQIMNNSRIFWVPTYPEKLFQYDQEMKLKPKRIGNLQKYHAILKG
jgi:hypothetical protein